MLWLGRVEGAGPRHQAQVHVSRRRSLVRLLSRRACAAQEDGGGQGSSFGLPPADGGGMDNLAAEMAKLDREIAGSVIERPAWMQRPTPAELAAATAAHAADNSSPSHRSQHSRTSSFGGRPPLALFTALARCHEL